ncbi:MAG TPA: PTS sugar transporter subunit IIC [Candidatus Eisenbacteria bacterium]|nr:PTS sugar transporter subunit IIC [Candidatus Eisenbacteria bacterium]
MNLQLLSTLLLAGVAALDATPVAQTFLSQPLVMGTLLGALWGDWRTAMQVAVVLQILAASTAPVGSRTPEDYAVGGVTGIGTALVLSAAHPFTIARDACAMIGVIVGLLAATLGASVLRWQRRRNEGLARWCEERLQMGDETALGAAQRAAVVLAFAAGVAYCAACMAAAVFGLQRLVTTESLWLARAWHLAQPLWLGLGLAQLLHAFVQRRLSRIAVFGGALIAAWLGYVVGTR